MRVAFLTCSLLSLAAVLSAQHSYTRAEIDNGARLYQASCATCHGANGDTVRGVNVLSGQFRRAQTDDELMRIIQRGIPDTAMAPSSYSDIEAGMIVAYLRSSAAGEKVAVIPGDRARGRALFDGKGKCVTCHGADGTGSRFAPSLTDVGALRRPLDLERALVDPSADLHMDFRFVRIVARNGATIMGRLLNQSTFSVQILESSERLRSLDKADIKELQVLPTSPMPSYRTTFTDQELADVVSYLTTLRGQR